MNLIPRETDHVEHPFQNKMLEKLWEPITIGGKTCKNRISLGPIGGGDAIWTYPNVGPADVALHEAIAKGGCGIVTIAETDPSRKKSPPEAHETEKEWWPRWWRNMDTPRYARGIHNDAQIPGWTKWCDALHKHGAMVWVQLWCNAVWQVWPWTTHSGGKTQLHIIPWDKSGMTPEALENEIEDEIAASVRAQKAGFDGVQFHGTADNLVGTQISIVRNPGTPGFSENFEARFRFVREAIQGIKKACGKDFVVATRLSPVEYIEGGYDIEYAKQVAKAYAEAGIDVIDVAQAGFTTTVPQLQMVDPPGAYAHYARAVKSHLASLGPPYSKVVIQSACRINNPWLAASLLRNGACDMVTLCRQLIADPDWPNKIKEGRLDDIRPCLACVWCMPQVAEKSGAQHGGAGEVAICGMHPQSNQMMAPERRAKLEMTKAKKVKKVLVAGGGAAGMEASRVLALRGHKVILCEKEEELGRLLRVQSYPPGRTDIDLMRKYLSTQVRNLGVDVRCNQKVTPDLVKKEKPDTVVVATGCRPKLPEIPGINRHPHVVFAEDVLLQNVDVGSRIVVIDADSGHDVGCLGSYTAQFVARSVCVRDDVAMYIARWSPVDSPEKCVAMNNTPIGKQVTLVTGRVDIAHIHWHHFTTTQQLRRLGVKLLMGCEYKEINDKGVVFRDAEKKEKFLEADTIIVAQYESNKELYKELEGKVPELHLIGDAKAVRVEIMGAIQEAYRLALTI